MRRITHHRKGQNKTNNQGYGVRDSGCWVASEILLRLGRPCLVNGHGTRDIPPRIVLRSTKRSQGNEAEGVRMTKRLSDIYPQPHSRAIELATVSAALLSHRYPYCPCPGFLTEIFVYQACEPPSLRFIPH